VLYKHSTRCGLCDDAIGEVERHPASAGFYYLDLLAHRGVSDAIARRLEVKPESPPGDRPARRESRRGAEPPRDPPPRARERPEVLMFSRR
jgi:hypothetical protein